MNDMLNINSCIVLVVVSIRGKRLCSVLDNSICEEATESQKKKCKLSLVDKIIPEIEDNK